ncbi:MULTISPECIES: collagen-like triple helix repeat-containing protein [Sphingobacterium]|uniref:collagen-like triple helix repeat-containing protein n=1 Tax=Sphingobacterium TaxID=28453 RepID=UPI00257C2C9C|nr:MULTISPECIES: collagen-like protein [Sphingobacterium]
MNVVKTLAMVNLGLIMLFSCKKGDTGQPGQQGPKGDQGTTGMQGEKGADGATIFSGTTVPGATLGKNGDYYIRKNTSEMYGPKTDAGWGVATSFRGAAGTNGTNGTNGAAGTKILSGTAIPAVSLGAVGDFYFKTDTYQLFGPKTASGWGAGINLKGATGAANVIYSGWQYAKDVNKDSVIDATSCRLGHLPANGLTAIYLNNSAILVYMDYGGGLFALPYTSNAGGKTNTISFVSKINQIIVYRFAHDGSNSIRMYSFLKFRYVLIPGGVMASLKRKGVDLNNNQAIESALKEEQ